MDSNQTRQMLNRVMTSQEGIDFVAYLKELSLDNYKSFKTDTPEMNEIHKGYAMAIDSLIDALQTSVETKVPKVITFG